MIELSANAQEWFDAVHDSDPSKFGQPSFSRLLYLAAETFDIYAQARSATSEHGLTYTDRYGNPCKRPEVAIAKDAQVELRQLIKAMELSDDQAAALPKLASRKRAS